MATENKTTKNHCRPAVAWRLIGEQLGIKMPSRFKREMLSEALLRFEGNRTCWHEPYSDTNQTILQLHLCFTLLVPGGKADRARMAVDRLRYELLPFSAKYRPGRAELLDLIGSYVRFPNQKVDRLLAAVHDWDAIATVCRNAVCGNTPAIDLRKRLMATVDGFGEKAAAHFMRNTGLSAGDNAIPIVDTHIRKALAAYKLPHASYADAEESFRQLAAQYHLPVLLLDAALWCAYSNNYSMADFDNFGYW